MRYYGKVGRKPASRKAHSSGGIAYGREQTSRCMLREHDLAQLPVRRVCHIILCKAEAFGVAFGYRFTLFISDPAGQRTAVIGRLQPVALVRRIRQAGQSEGREVAAGIDLGINRDRVPQLWHIAETRIDNRRIITAARGSNGER